MFQEIKNNSLLIRKVISIFINNLSKCNFKLRPLFDVFDLILQNKIFKDISLTPQIEFDPLSFCSPQSMAKTIAYSKGIKYS